MIKNKQNTSIIIERYALDVECITTAGVPIMQEAI
jgi:hypothetical protein